MEPDYQNPYSRTYIALLGIASSLVIFAVSERCFENADIRNAIMMVQSLKASNNTPSIPQALLIKHPHAALNTIRYEGKIQDSCYGFVRVTITAPELGEIVTYLFDVNLSGQRLHPANKNAKLLLNELRAYSTPHEKKEKKEKNRIKTTR